MEHRQSDVRGPVKFVRMGDLYREQDLRRARIIYNSLRDGPPKTLKDTIRCEIVNPRLTHINLATGQQNDPDYLAYHLIHVLGQVAQD